MTGRSALVTGGTGFVGSHLIKRLVAEGWQVHAIVRPSSDISLLAESSGSLVLHTHHGTTESMQAIMAAAQPAVVFHLASLFLSEHRPKDIKPLIQSNLQFGTQLIEAMTRSGSKALVNTGTSWQHYENRDYSPVNLYAATKQAFEALLQYYVEACGLRVITLKLCDTYGPDDPRPKLMNLLKRVAADNQPLAMSPGRQYIDLVHVEDVVAAFMMAAQRLLAGDAAEHERYGVSSGRPLQLRELVEHAAQALGHALPITWGGRLYRAREVMQPWEGSVLPGWEPEIDLATGMNATLSIES